MENKEWFGVINYAGLYRITKHGIIQSLHKRNFGKEITARIDRGGYLTVRLSKAGVTKTHFLHRLIAETFITKIDGRDFVNHINGNKLDNQIENLEWVTHSENVTHAYKKYLIKKISKVVIDNCNDLVFSSTKVAANYYGINYHTLRCYLNGEIKNKTCLQYQKVA